MKQNSHKLYVLVDRTLSESQQAVQACHAVASFALKYSDIWVHQSLVLLGLDGEEELEYWQWKLRNFNNIPFYEPHYNDRLTAIACYGCDEEVKTLTLL